MQKQMIKTFHFKKMLKFRQKLVIVTLTPSCAICIYINENRTWARAVFKL
jgi:hypothetical protein